MKLNLTRKLSIGYTMFVMVLTLTPAVFALNEQNQPTANSGIVFFTVLALSMLGGGVYSLISKYKRSKGLKKIQLELIIFGVAGSFSLILVSNLLLVVVFNVLELVPFAPAFTLIFSCSMAYAIIKHELFDIRAVVARSVAYVFALGIIGVVYGLLVLLLLAVIGTDDLSHQAERVIFVFMALLTAVAYPPIKQFFDKLSNKMFYRDAYDPQLLLDQLNKILVSEVEIDALLQKTGTIMEEKLKSDYVIFSIPKTTYSSSRIIGRGKHHARQIDNVLENIPISNSEIIITDFIEGNERIHERLVEEDISILIPLLSGTERVGAIVIGPKKSGSLYTKQDMQVLQIVANELVIAVQNALRFEEIQNFNEKLQKEVEEATSQLKEKNRKLIELDQTKDDFISMASHQLRTPLTSVKGYLSMTLEGDAGKLNEKQENLLTQAFISSERMVYLISDMLNLSRLKTGKFVIDTGPVNLAELIDTEIAQLQGTAKARDLKLTFEKPANFPILMLDETKIRQVIMNFVDNAIYYTPSGGEIDVKLVDKDKSIELTVTDTGIGVPKSERHHLFSKFYRAKNAKKARPDGTGLGLFMAKKVIIAQGGGIIFHSQEGKGSTFGFTFNKKQLTPKDKN